MDAAGHGVLPPWLDVAGSQSMQAGACVGAADSHDEDAPVLGLLDSVDDDWPGLLDSDDEDVAPAGHEHSTMADEEVWHSAPDSEVQVDMDTMLAESGQGNSTGGKRWSDVLPLSQVDKPAGPTGDSSGLLGSSDSAFTTKRSGMQPQPSVAGPGSVAGLGSLAGVLGQSFLEAKTREQQAVQQQRQAQVAVQQNQQAVAQLKRSIVQLLDSGVITRDGLSSSIVDCLEEGGDAAAMELHATLCEDGVDTCVELTQVLLASTAASGGSLDSSELPDSSGTGSSSNGGGDYSGRGLLDSSRPAIVTSAVDPDIWQQRRRRGVYNRLQVQKVAYRQGPHALRGRHAPLRQLVESGAASVSIDEANERYQELHGIWQGAHKFRAAEQLDKLLAIVLQAQGEDSQYAWTEAGLPMRVLRTALLLAADPMGVRHADTQRLPDAEVIGYAASTTLALLVCGGLEALHIVRNIQLDHAQAAMLRSEIMGFLSKLVRLFSELWYNTACSGVLLLAGAAVEDLLLSE